MQSLNAETWLSPSETSWLSWKNSPNAYKITRRGFNISRFYSLFLRSVYRIDTNRFVADLYRHHRCPVMGTSPNSGGDECPPIQEYSILQRHPCPVMGTFNISRSSFSSRCIYHISGVSLLLYDLLSSPLGCVGVFFFTNFDDKQIEVDRFIADVWCCKRAPKSALPLKQLVGLQ